MVAILISIFFVVAMVAERRLGRWDNCSDQVPTFRALDKGGHEVSVDVMGCPVAAAGGTEFRFR